MLDRGSGWWKGGGIWSYPGTLGPAGAPSSACVSVSPCLPVLSSSDCLQRDHRGHSKKTAVHKPGGLSSTGKQIAGTLILDFPGSGPVRCPCLLLGPPGLQCFVNSSGNSLPVPAQLTTVAENFTPKFGAFLGYSHSRGVPPMPGSVWGAELPEVKKCPPSTRPGGVTSC